MMRFTLALALALSVVGCAKAPPNLSPQSVAAFKGTQAIQALDLLRDAAIAAHDATPQIISEDATRQIVTYHRSAIMIIHTVPDGGWEASIAEGLVTIQQTLSDRERAHLYPYFTIARAIILEVR